MAFDYSSVKNKKRKDEKPSGFDYSSIKGKTERTDEEKREYIKQRNTQKNNVQNNRQQVAYSGRYDSEKGKIGYSNYLKTKEPKSKDIDFGNLFALAGYSTGSNEALPNISETTYGLRQDTSYKEPGEDWLDEEKNIFGYLWENDRAAAEKYAIEVNNAVNRYKKDLETEKVAEYSTENLGQGILASVSSIASNAGSGSDFLADLVEYNARGVVTEREGFLTPYEYTQAVRGSIANDLNEYGTVLGKGLGDAYQIGMSAADSFVYGHLGIADPAYFGIGATAAMNEARERGVSENQAFAYGITSGIMEAVFEHIGIDNMLKMKSPHTLSQAFKGILKQSGVEALEEMGTELTNTAWDAIINMDKSEFVASYANYISEGKGRGEALARAFADLGGEVLWAGISGALSGTMTGTVQTGFAKTGEIFGDAVNKADARKAVKDLGKDRDAVLDYAMETEEGSEGRKAAEDIKAKTEKGEAVSNREYAEVLKKANEDFEIAEIKKQIKAETMSTGETITDEQIDAMSKSVLKTIKGKMVSEQENAQIEQSQSAKNVYARNMGIDYTYGEQLSKEKKAELKETRTQQVFSEAVKDHSEGYKQTLTKAYEDYAQGNEALKMDAEDFVNEFSSFYDIGRAGVESVDRALEAYGKGNPQLTNALARAYELGRGEAIVANKASVENKQAEIDAKLEATKGMNVTSIGQVRLATEAELKNPKVAAVGGKVVTKGKKLSKQHRATMQFVREFAKLSGINVVLYEGGKSRGWYDSVNNEIYLNIEEGMNLKTLSHELTHFIQEHSPKQYEEFKQFLLDYYKANGKYQQLLQQAHKVQRDLAAEELEDEIVANACQMFISDTDAMQKLIDTQSKGLIDTITRWFNNMCDYLRQAFEGVHASHAAAQALEEDIEMLEKARDKWYKLLNESITVNKKINGTQSTTSQVKKADSKAKFELKDDEYMTAVNNGDMETAQKLVDEAAKAAGYNIHAFHGTSRGDRVGNVFLPERATSGPMAFFTDDKATAEGYATGKRDTSIAYDPDFDSYETQFRVKVSGMDIPFHRAWGYLPFDARNRVAKKAGQLREDWDGENELILDPETNEANGGFQWQLKEARGNVIKALIDQWLNSGNLFNEEAKFLDVIEMSGLKEEFAKVGINTIYFKDPNARYEKVYDVYLKMDRPFDTAKVNKRFVTNLLKWYDKQDERKYQRENMESDLWDKNGIDAYDFAERLERDIENNTTHAWTSIPDSVTDYLKHLKYDGIKDLGGKFHETTHTVWIPFYSEQIKTTEPVTYDNKGKVIPLSERFNDYDRDIRFEMKDSEGNDLSPEQVEFFKNSKVRDENGALKVMHHGTNSAGFTVFDPLYSDDAISLFFTDNTDVAGSYSSLPDDSRYDPYNENTDIKTAADFGNLYQQTYTEKKSGENIFKIRVEKVSPELTKHFTNKLEADGLQLVHSAERFLKEAEKFYSMPYENYENEDLIEEAFKTLREAQAHNLEYGTIEEIGRALPDIMDAISTLSVVAQHYFNYHVLLENPSNMADLGKQVVGLEEREKMAWQIRGGYEASEDMLEMFKHNKGKWVWFTEASNRGIRNGTKAIGIDPDDDATMFGTEEEVVKRAVKFGADTGMINVGGNRYDVYLNLENPYIYEGEEKFKGTLWSFEIVKDIYDEYDVYVMFDRNAKKKHVDHFFDQYEVEQFIKQSVTDKDVKAKLLREITGDFANVPVDLVINDYWNNLKGPDGSKWNTRKYTQYAKDNGYDGIIFKGIFDNGGQSHYEEADVPSTIAVAFSSEQVKDIDNKAPTKDKDIRFELKDDIDNLVLANYNSIRLPVQEFKRLEHAIKTYYPQQKGLITHLLDNEEGEPAYLYTVFVDNDSLMKVVGKKEGDYYDERREYQNADREAKGFDWYVSKYKNQRDNGGISGIGFERKPNGRTGGLFNRETSGRNGSNGGRGYQSISDTDAQNEYDPLEYYIREKEQYELKDEDENRLEILGNQEERLVNDLKTIEKYYGDAIRQVYEQNIKPNEGISKRAEELNRKAARRFMNEVGAMFQVPKDTREEYLLPIINEMIDKGPAISDREGLIERLYQTAYEHTEDYIVDTDPEGNYKNLRNYIRKTSIFVNAGTKADVGDYNNFRKHNMGSLRLTSDQTALGLDEFYDEVSNLAPEIFSGTTDGAEQLYELSSFMKDRGRTESIGDYMPQAEYTAWADETLEPELNKLFDSTVGSFLSEVSRKERERQRAAKVDRAMENVSGAIRNYEAAQDYARAEGVLAGQIEQGKKDAAEMRRMQESYERKAKNYENMLEAKRAKIAEIRQRRDEILAERKAAFEAYREMRNNTIRNGGLRKRIEKSVKKLNEKLLKPTDVKHIPEDLKEATAALLENFVNDTSVFPKAKLDALREAYDNIRTSGRDLEELYDEDIASNIKSLKETIGGKRLSELNTEQLKQIYEVVASISHMVSDGNKLFINGRKQDIESFVEDIQITAMKHGNKKKASGLLAKPVNYADKYFNYDNIIPPYFFDDIGGGLKKLYDDMLYNGGLVWTQDINESRQFMADIFEKYHVWDWTSKNIENRNKVLKFKTERGDSVELSVNEALSVYATYKRGMANGDGAAHLMQGGIVVDLKEDNGILKFKSESKKGKPLTVNDIQKIMSFLTEEQMKCADEIVEYLTVVDGEKRNETSMQLHGYKKFNEKYYFPYHVDSSYVKHEPGQPIEEKGNAQSVTRLKNMGSSKVLTPHANAAVHIGDFFDVVAQSMEETASYHGYALVQDNFMRVLNYKNTVDKEGFEGSSGVAQAIKDAYGNEAYNYINKLMGDIFGGPVQIEKDMLMGMLNNFKKTSVVANLSVTVQQPSAIVRAITEIEPKYLLKAANQKNRLEEMFNYSSTAFLKNMGRFDVGTGFTAQQYILKPNLSKKEYLRQAVVTNSKYDIGARDEALGYLTEKADWTTWGWLMNAAWAKVEAETELEPGSEEFKKVVGRLFDRITNKTQVYDSVLVKSPLARSKNVATQMSAAFMNEPILSYNMVMDGAKKGGKRFKTALVAYTFSQLGNAFLWAFVGALRDDDEDKTYGEKYVKAFTSKFVSNIIPFANLPYISQIISIIKGFDVENMAYSPIVDAIEAFEKANKSFQKYEYGEGLKELTVAFNLVGLPIRNIVRDFESLFAFDSAPIGSASASDLWNAAVEGFEESLGIKESKTDGIKSAMRNGNSSKIKKEVNESIQKYVKEGKTEKQAKQYIKTSLTSYWKPIYINNEKRRAEIRKAIFATGLYGSADDVVKTCNKWLETE